MSWASTAPLAMRNLAALLAAWPALVALGVKVKDMGDLSDRDAMAVLTVGYLNPEEDSHAEAVNASADLSGAVDREAITIRCGLAVLTGDEDSPSAARDAAFAILAGAGSCLVANQTLDGAVMNAVISGWSLRTDQVTGGYRAQIDFSVSVDAFTQR
jgi:hypothetical protein